MLVNLIHAVYDEHHRVSSFLKAHQNTHNSVKYEVIWKWHFVMLIHKSIESQYLFMYLQCPN